MREALPQRWQAWSGLGRWLRRLVLLLALLALAAVLWIGSGVLVPGSLQPYIGRLQGFVTIFFGIFVEALPFLLAGVLVSAAIHLFVTPERLQRLLPRQPLAAALAGSVLGLAFPVCECGSIPAARSLIQKGAPLPLAMAFVLAAPVVNPVVIVSTAVAFVGVLGWQFVAWRVGLSILVAVFVGLLLGLTRRPERVLAPAVFAHVHDLSCAHDHHDHSAEHGPALQRVLAHAGGEFFEMVRYLIVGALIAATMQSFLPPALLIGLGQGPLLSVLVMMAMAVVLSICSTVDSFVALSFVGTFSPGALLAFLVFGPMVDIKSFLMYSSTFSRRTVALIGLLCFQTVLLLCLAINLYL